MSEITTVFFDLGNTLITPVIQNGAITAFQPFDFAVPVLRRLQEAGVRLGVISNTGAESRQRMDSLMQAAGLQDFFEPGLLIYSSEVHLSKPNHAIFTFAAGRAGVAADRCMYVGENPRERHVAKHDVGMAVSPHPLLVEEVLASHALHYVRVEPAAGVPTAEWHAALRALPLPMLPLHLLQSDPRSLYAIASQRVLEGWDTASLGAVRRLGPENPQEETDLYLVEAEQPPVGTSEHRYVVDVLGESLVVAVPNEAILEHFHRHHPGHGDRLLLIAQPHLLDPPAPQLLAAFAVMADAVADRLLPEEELQAWEELTPGQMKDRVDRYSGQAPIEPGQPQRIESRNTAHPGNLMAVEALERELTAMGGGRLQVRRQSFTHQGRTLYNVIAELPGASPEMVLISAHLDSTAESSPGYRREISTAPGADDDASGMAAVMSIAERILALSEETPLARTAQFVLFNDEEYGLVGSQVYARFLRNAGASIAGVFQMDMIGYNVRDPRDWEIHIGVESSPEVEEKSRMLAQAIFAAAARVAPDLPPPQLYDSHTGDPATGRSDHGPFHAQGYAACAVTEDFFGGFPGAPAPSEANPHYHKQSDLVIDPDFAADIARAVGAAAWAWLTQQTLTAPVQEFTPAKRRR